MKLLGRACLLLLTVSSLALADTYTVTTTADTGSGSLRQAITDANTHAGADNIAFAIPGGGVQTIALASALPDISEALTIDGYTQSGASPNTHPLEQPSNAILMVEIDGEAIAGGTTPCIGITASNVEIRGLVINRCNFTAITQTTGSNATIAGNFIGTNPQGGAVVSDVLQDSGITFNSGSGHRIGGPNPADRNVISGNRNVTGVAGDAIYVGGSASADIQGNFIGTDSSAAFAVPNGNGIRLQSTGTVHVGGTAEGEGNIVGGNGNLGIYGIAPATMYGNFIGADTTGERRLPNRGGGVFVGGSGLSLIGGVDSGQANVIAFNGGGSSGAFTSGLGISGSGITVRGNRIYDNNNRGIALGTNFPSPNDSGDGDSGPNGLQNYPIITSVDYGATTTVHALFNSKPSATYTVDFYANPACSGRPPLYQQGHDFAGSTTATTDAGGNTTIDFTLPIVLEAGQPVTAVATDSSGNSSEFSQSILLHTDRRSGPAAGNTGVGLLGQMFEDGATVTFGGAPAQNVTFTNANLLHGFTPALAPGTVNDVVVTNPGGLSGTLRNAWVVDFLDVPNTNTFYADVVKLIANQITVGIGGGLYGVADNIKRQSMAVFILKAEHGICYTPPPCTGAFSDVPCPSTFAPWIEAMAAEGITGGCGGGNFCPANPVRRDQMAVFLLKGKHGAAYAPPPCTGVFTDVPCPGTFANWIEELKGESVTSGCGGTSYCPGSSNTRGQMATFIVKTFGLY